MAQAMRQLWSVKEVASFIGMSPSFVTKQAVAGRLPYIRMGVKMKFLPESIELYVKSLETRPMAGVDSSDNGEPAELSKAS